MGRGSNCFQGAAEEAQIDGLASHQREAMRQALMWQRQSASPRLHPSAPPAALKETSLAKGGPAGWMHNGRPNAKSPPVSKPENDGINIDTTRNHSCPCQLGLWQSLASTDGCCPTGIPAQFCRKSPAQGRKQASKQRLERQQRRRKAAGCTPGARQEKGRGWQLPTLAGNQSQLPHIQRADDATGRKRVR